MPNEMDRKGAKKPTRKPYLKPELERMNEKVGVVTGQPPVPGAPASAQASPIAPGATVF
jgi:hypothetical protein